MGKVLHVVLLAIVLSCTSAEDADDKGETVSETVAITPPGDEQVEEEIDTEKRAIDYNVCFVRGRVYKHGDIFKLTGTSPCVRYHCENGVAKIVEDGCYVKQQSACIQINANTELDCVTYRCTKTSDSNTVYYNFEPINLGKCKDYYGRCRPPGEVFPYEINGRLYSNCVCRQVGPRNVQYNCSNI